MSEAATFESEAALCAAFVAALPKGWTPYPETAHWDLLLVRDQDGFQIGVEAKLRLNAEVLNQAIETRQDQLRGPDCRAVLVPGGKIGRLSRICNFIGITVIQVHSAKKPNFWPPLPPVEDRMGYIEREWHECCPAERIPLPDYVPDVTPGTPAPVKLTGWKIKAIKIAVIIELRGHVTREDFKALDIDIRRWLPREQGWLQPSSAGFEAGPNLPDFKAQHPRVYDDIKADAETWMPAPSMLQLTLPGEAAS